MQRCVDDTCVFLLSRLHLVLRSASVHVIVSPLDAPLLFITNSAKISQCIKMLTFVDKEYNEIM